MEREHKVWGERWICRGDSTHEASLLFLKPDTRCSWHSHREKYNLFVVVYGRVGIVTEYEEVILERGEHFTVQPGLKHEFRSYKESLLFEEMYVEYQSGDIQRNMKQLGGSLNPIALQDQTEE